MSPAASVAGFFIISHSLTFANYKSILFDFDENNLFIKTNNYLYRETLTFPSE